MKQYWRVIVLVIESASFAAIAQTFELAFYAAKFPGVYFIADSVVQTVSMAPLLISAFIGLTSSENETSEVSYGPRPRLSNLRFDHVKVELGAGGKSLGSLPATYVGNLKPIDTAGVVP